MNPNVNSYNSTVGFALSPPGGLDWHWSGRRLRGQLAPRSNLPPGAEFPIVHYNIWMSLNTAAVITLPASLQEVSDALESLVVGHWQQSGPRAWAQGWITVRCQPDPPPIRFMSQSFYSEEQVNWTHGSPDRKPETSTVTEGPHCCAEAVPGTIRSFFESQIGKLLRELGKITFLRLHDFSSWSQGLWLLYTYFNLLNILLYRKMCSKQEISTSNQLNMELLSTWEICS